VNRHLTRAAATLTGVAIAAMVAMPVLAASTATPVTAGADPATTDTGITRCVAAWAAARGNRTVGTVKAVGDCEVDRRLDALDRLGSRVDNAAPLTDPHAASLNAILDGSTTGLKALRVEIDGDTTLAEVTADVRRVFTDYRVYALVSRQVVLVVADDRVDATADRLTQAGEQLDAAIEQAKANGKDVSDAQAHRAAMAAAIAAARGDVDGDAGAILGQTPATWNAGTAKPVLDAGRASISAARSDLRTALQEARATMAALR
jgi:hypothetical protein